MINIINKQINIIKKLQLGIITKNSNAICILDIYRHLIKNNINECTR